MMTPIFIVPFFIVFATVDVFAAVTRKLDYPLICHLNSKHSAHHRNSKIDCSDDFFVPVHWAGAIAGALSCSLSHVLLLPIDVLKTKIQSGADATIHIRDLSAVLHGVAPTLTGYFLQGGCKFGFYEYFKGRVLSQRISKGPLEVSALLACAGVAELIASFMLCPLEVTKIYMLSNPDAARRGMTHCMRQICIESGALGLFQGLPWVLLRQLPYTCVKLSSYDVLISRLQQHSSERIVSPCLGSKAQARDDSSSVETNGVGGRQELGMQLLSGVFAGMLAAVVSNPADVILSKVCARNPNLQECIIIQSAGDLVQFVRSLGWAGCLSGLPERCVMVTSLTTLQFASYERIKAFVRTQSRSPSRNPIGAPGTVAEASSD